MQKALFSLLLLLMLSLPSCRRPVTPDAPDASALVAEATQDVGRQRYEAAMEKALRALSLSAGDPLLEVQALSTIVGIDIMTSRDADAWEKALQAEAIARRHGFRRELSEILIAKAKLCSYAEISPETGRNDEGLGYAREALAIAEADGLKEQEAEACLVTGSLYINKNRWNDPIDPQLYSTAGEWLDRGQAVADAAGIDRLRRNALLFRSRWFQQGDRNEEALHYFAAARAALPEDDHLMASSLDDRLVRLYTRVGDSETALDTHDDYVYEITQYMTQKSDETLQEIQTRFEVQEKERRLERRGYQLTVLTLMVLLAVAVIIIGVNYLRRARRRNEELMRINDTKEQLIALLSRDLRNPVHTYKAGLEKLSADAATLSSDEVRERCAQMARGAQTMNEEVADYVGGILIERGRRIADIGLTRREIEIIRLSAEGLTAAEIAERIFLSVHTVNTHRQRIYAKMGVKNVSEMLRVAGDLGIV